MRFITATVIATIATGTAWKMDALPQFVGAALGAFTATIMRNDKRKLKLIVDNAVSVHEKKLHGR